MPLELPCPLRAYRTPGDEAGLEHCRRSARRLVADDLSIDVFLTLLCNGLRVWTEKLGPYLVFVGLWALVALAISPLTLSPVKSFATPSAYAVLCGLRIVGLGPDCGGKLADLYFSDGPPWNAHPRPGDRR